MREVYEQLGELIKGFVFDAGRLGVKEMWRSLTLFEDFLSHGG